MQQNELHLDDLVSTSMACGKFNKRSGGPRLYAENEEEIEIRNNRLAEVEVERQARRDAEDDSEDDEGDDGDW